MNSKRPYVCGPLTELPREMQEPVKNFYRRIADVCQDVLGKRAFLPHEHSDPVNHSHLTAQQVDEFDRRQVCKFTDLLLVVAIAPSWGGGIEVEMARQSGVRAIILHPLQKRISRLLLGNPAVSAVIPYQDEDDAVASLIRVLLGLRSAA